jgi:beta-glucosidase
MKSDQHQTIEQRVEKLLGQLTLKEKVALLSGRDNWHSFPIDRLGIPPVPMTDGPHGVRLAHDEAGRKGSPATSFPTGVSIAASWDTDLVERVGQALGEETLAMGCSILLGPCVNIVRHPLAGRNFESYSEDPYLAGQIGTAWVKGVQSKGAGASLKHFSCNNQEIERGRGSSVIDERTLREIYLAQFETIVKEADPWTVMCSYNRINGVYASENHHTLTEILKDEWGYKGVVISDWGANHTIFESVKGGLDIEMGGPARYYGPLLVDAVRNWQIDEAVIDSAVRRILQMVVKSGRMDDPGRFPKGSLNTPAHQALARELAEESITLLKNEKGVLPIKLAKIKSIAVIGPNAAEAAIGGGGSSFLEPPYRVSPLQGLKSRLEGHVEVGYEQGCDNFVDMPTLKTGYLLPASGSGHGLTGEYFANTTFDGDPQVVKVDSEVDFWWMNFGEGQHIPPAYSARWTGKLAAPASGHYAFQVNHNFICRLFIDGEMIIESRKPDSNEINSEVKPRAYKELAQGQVYDIRLEFIKPVEVDFGIVRMLFAFSPKPEDDDRLAKAVALAKKSDVAVIFAGLPQGYESEGGDRPDMELTGSQTELIRAVAKANPNTVVVVNAGAPVTMPWFTDVPAVIEAFYPGMEGGNAIARVLLGEVNPSGKLPVTFPKRLEDTPAFNNYPGGKEVLYGEGIFVGYRHYDQRDIQPLFPFGYGLSYTTFAFSDLKVPGQVERGEPVSVTVTVTNTGAVAGKEVVQVYVSDNASSLPRPPKELKGFQKVSLAAGESKTITLTLDERALSFYDPYQSKWVAEPGKYEILVGSSSRDIRAKATFTLE